VACGSHTRTVGFSWAGSDSQIRGPLRFFRLAAFQYASLDAALSFLLEPGRKNDAHRELRQARLEIQLANLKASVAPYSIWYNFIRIHKTLRVTPAMEAGVTDRLWSLEDMVGIVDEWEAAQRQEANG